MKSTILIILATLVITACSPTKQVVETTTPTVVTETKVEVPPKYSGTTPDVGESDMIKNEIETEDETDIENEMATEDLGNIETEQSEENESQEIVQTTFDHSNLNNLLNRFVTKDGVVNYTGFKNNWNLLRNYISSLSESIPTEAWSKNERLAYWMNAYNAMTIDLILRHQPIESIKDIKNPWDQRFWKLGEKWYNLNEIEHEILRKMDEPRIHFGIVCASYSCPPLLNEAFTAAKVDAQLDAVAHQFVNDPQRNSITRDRVEISKIFTWFKKDFTTNGSLIAYLNQYADTKISEDARIRFMDYNWALND